MQSMRLFYVALLAAALVPAAALAQTKTKIGVLNDQSGVYSDDQGIGSVIAAQLAVEDYAKKLGVDAEIVTGDHQNKVDIGTAIARGWYENGGVDVVMDLPNSAIALGVNTLAKDLNKIMIGSGAGTATLTGSACTPNTIHWTYDTWELGHSIARAVYQRGGKKWFFITADYVFGKDLEANASEEVKALGGEVVGLVRAPLGTSDYSSFLVQAQAAKPDVIALAVARAHITNPKKQPPQYAMPANNKIPRYV